MDSATQKVEEAMNSAIDALTRAFELTENDGVFLTISGPTIEKLTGVDCTVAGRPPAHASGVRAQSNRVLLSLSRYVREVSGE